MTTTTMRPLQVLHDDSFPPPQMPCVEASSVKSRRSLLDLLTSPRRAPQESNLRHARIPPPPIQKTEPQDPASRNLPKTPRSILRVIATKFRNLSPISPTSPPPVNAKQNREAALRERGLLPPLKPNQDLSKQEAQLDQFIPVVPHHHNSTDDSGLSAADLIKQEWEARNKSLPATEEEERDRLNNFKFGGSSTKLSEATESQSVTEINTPHSAPSLEELQLGPQPPDLVKDGSSQTQSRRSNGQDKPDPLSLPSSSHLPTPPPTPHNLTSISSGSRHPNPSFHYSRHPDEDSSPIPTSSHNPKTSISASAPAPPPTNPVISLTPPSQIDTIYDAPSSYAYNSNRKSDSISRMPSIAESVSSIITPSLDTSSRTTTTISTLNTSESLMNSATIGSGNSSGVKGKNNMHILKVKTHDHHHHHMHMHNNIPMIVESPVEDSFGQDSNLKTMVDVESDDIVVPVLPEERGKGLGQLPLTPVFEGNTTSSSNVNLNLPGSNDLNNSNLTKRGRAFSDLGVGVGNNRDMKRKSFNLFKRSVVIQDSSNANEKKLSVTTSFTNLKKAANNLTRAKSTHDFNRPSTAASSFYNTNTNTATTKVEQRPSSAGQQSQSLNGRITGVGLRPEQQQQQRRPIGPTMHNRGSILVEASAIQDDEVRRMTELAFLG